MKICYRCQETSIVSHQFRKTVITSNETIHKTLQPRAPSPLSVHPFSPCPAAVRSETNNIDEVYEERLCDEYDDEEHDELSTINSAVENEEFEYEYEEVIMSESASVLCNICQEEFEDMSKLECHLRLHDDVTEVFACEICNEEFSSPILLSNHSIKHDASKKQKKIERLDFELIEIASNQGDSKRTKIHYEKDENGRFICHICRGTYSSRDILSRHLIKHTSSKEFKCSLCPREFYFRRDLNTHLKQHYEPKKKFACPHDNCESEFTSSSSLKKHSLTHLDNSRNFKCGDCNLNFKTKGNLKNHYRTHTNEKPFECFSCGSAFSQKIILHRHMRNIHNLNIYVCEFCNLSFEKHGGLRDHWKECESLRNRSVCEEIDDTSVHSIVYDEEN